MDSKKIKILIVTNSVPLPVTDFLKYKVNGLSKHFDLHLICWDSEKNKKAYLRQYPDSIDGEHLHLYTKFSGIKNIMLLLLANIALFLTHPKGVLDLLKKVRANNKGLKRIVHDYLLYAPIIPIQPDIIHFEFGTLAHGFQDVKDYFRCKASSSFRGYDLNYVGLTDDNYYTKVWDTFDGFHFLGNDLKLRAIRRGYQTGKAEALIPPAVNTSLFTPADKQVNGQTGKLRILSTSRLVWKKGLEYGIQATAILRQKGIPFEYHIIGDGDYTQALQFTIFEMGLQDDVKLLGRKNNTEIKQMLSSTDVFLHPAISEGFCNAVIEAQAMGIPVVTTDADGLSENVADGETGFIVPKWNAAALADRLQWCYEHPQQAIEMGQKGIERVKQHFRLEDQINAFTAFYTALYTQQVGTLPAAVQNKY